jgi:hypothetical protein
VLLVLEVDVVCVAFAVELLDTLAEAESPVDAAAFAVACPPKRMGCNACVLALPVEKPLICIAISPLQFEVDLSQSVHRQTRAGL